MNEKRGLDIPVVKVNDEGKFDLTKIKPVDLVVTTPFCSGLSMMNTQGSDSNSPMARGSGAEQNKWIYETLDFSIKHLKAKVVIGENAPGLFSDVGIGVRNDIEAVAERYGYSVTYIKTNTTLHGIPQLRPRVFYFLWNTKTVPEFNFIKRPYVSYGDYMKKFDMSLVSREELDEKYKDVSDNVMFEYITTGMGVRVDDMRNKNRHTLLTYIYGLDTIPKYITWLKSKGADKELVESGERAKFTKYDHELRVSLLILNKIQQGLGAWDRSLIMTNPNNNINAIISKNAHLLLHPYELRTLTQKEKAYLMGLLSDMKVNDVTGQTIGQNVPVNTAMDMVTYAKSVINNKVDYTNAKVMMYDNTKGTSEVVKSSFNNIKLFSINIKRNVNFYSK